MTSDALLVGKVLARIKCEVSRKQQEDLANAVPGAIEALLALVRNQVRYKPWMTLLCAGSGGS